MKLMDFLNAANGRVSGGSEYGWSCYPNAQSLDVSDKDGLDCGSVIFNRTSHYVYEATVCVPNSNTAYRWSNAEYAWARLDEAKRRQIDDTLAWDNVKWTAIIGESTMLKIVKAVVEKDVYEPEVDVIDDADGDGFTVEFSGAAEPSGCGADCSTCSCRTANDIDDAMIASAAAADEEYDRSEEKEYNVSIEVTHDFDVRANSMEEAVMRAKLFVNKMRPGEHVDDVFWMDQYASKETVSRNLRTESIED